MIYDTTMYIALIGFTTNAVKDTNRIGGMICAYNP